MSFSVFGTKPANSIYLGDIPYAVRWNCKDGGLFIGGYEDEFRRTKTKETVEISIIKASKYFGTLGKTMNELWLQLFFVPGPGCLTLPKNQVCVSYIKKQSVNNLMACVSEAMESGEPAQGIFTGSFLKQAGDKGPYYTIGFSWRERQTDEEKQQLEMIEAFMALHPPLFDLTGTRDMACIDRLSTEEIQELVESAKAQARLEASNQPALPAAK
jgi:hypothetical protein